jgi:4-hydroxy-3-methylbut-2-enyl diphosphate reductase
VILESRDIAVLPFHSRMRIVSQTTQPLDRVLQLVDAVKRRHEGSEVRFIDTVCHPTKQRQLALEDLGRICDVIIVIGGRNSNNTRQLTAKAAALGPAAHQIETPEELDPTWLRGARNVGVTAGTSTLDETVQAVMDKLRLMAAEA